MIAPSAMNRSENSAELVPKYAPSAASGIIPVLLVIASTVMDVAPVTIPASTFMVPSKTMAEPDAGVILTAPVVVLIVTAASPCVRLSDAKELAEIPVKPDPLPDRVPPTVKFPLVVSAPFDATVRARVPSV